MKKYAVCLALVLLAGIAPAGCSKKRKSSYIPPPAVLAAFTGTPRTGDNPLTVQFTDQSRGTINTWQWNFGDGGTSTEQNPSHEYTSDGFYTVSLMISADEGDDTETKNDYITVGSGGSLPSYVVGFSNISVAVYDNTNASRLQELGDRLKNWVAYIWEMSGGQICVQKFTIDDNVHSFSAGDYLIFVPQGRLEDDHISASAYGSYDTYYDYISVGGLFYTMTLAHEWTHARMQHTPYEEYSYDGSCNCIMGPNYYSRWCDDYNHTNTCPMSCWESFMTRYPDWVAPHVGSTSSVPAAWTARSSEPCPTVTCEVNDN